MSNIRTSAETGLGISSQSFIYRTNLSNTLSQLVFAVFHIDLQVIIPELSFIPSFEPCLNQLLKSTL